MEKEYSLKQVASVLPSGVLGVHLQKSQPYNLVFRPESDYDVRRKFLLAEGWSSVKDREEVLWSAATLENYYTLEDSGMEVKISRKALDWLHRSRNEQLEKLYFEDRCPLFHYQKEAVEFLANRKRAMLSLSPGLGKTLTSAYASGVVKAKNILLVCPASLLYYWKAELEKWSEQLLMQPYPLVWHKRFVDPEREILKEEQIWVITNPETLSNKTAEFRRYKWDLMVVDESIMYKHRESTRSKKLKDIAKRIPRVWLLTGAPATRYLDDMWHQFHILDNRGYSSYWRFAEKYCVITQNQWSKQVVANKKDAEYAIKRNFEDIYFTRSQDEVTDIPEWLFEDIDVPLLSRQNKIYKTLRQDFFIELMGLEDKEILRIPNHISLMLRSLQVLSNPLLVGAEDSSGKWTVLPQLMDVYPGPYIVWVNFRKTGERLAEILGEDSRFERKVALVNGSTPMDKRNYLVQGFQDSRYDVIVMNNAVGKFGFNLTRARTSFFVERMYDDSMFQCLHRNRRIGTTEAPIVVNMRSVTMEGHRTIDHVVHDALDYRNSMIRKLTIGDIRKVLNL